MSSNQQQKQIYVHSDWSRDFAEVSQKTIGRGSFGRVFLVRSKESGKYYALKKIDLLQPILKMSILNQTYARDEGAKLIQLNVQHENILTYYRAYLHADHTINWLMEYCDGGTLKDRIRVYIRAAKQFEENLIWYWSMQILRGVEFLHANGIIHRDLKPDNVYIESKHGTCKIGDFGFAKVIGQASVNENTTISVVDDESQDGGGDSSVTVDSDRGELITTNGEAKIAYKLINVSQVGTPSYMAPECRCLVESHLNYCSIQTVEKATRLCERNIMKADIFSFGCIVYEMAVLRSAFENKFSLPASTEQIKQTRLGERLDRYSADLKAIIQLTLSFDPEERPDVQELLANPTIRVKMSDTSLADAYKSQVTPTLNLNATFAKKNVLECKQATLKECFKPISIKSLKFNQNFIVVLLNKHMNMQRASTVTVGEGIQRFTSKLHTFISTRDETPGPDGDGGESSEYIDESMFAVYNHYCKLVKEINVFRLTDNSGRAQSSESESLFGYMRFKSYDFCVDEENDHVYVSTLKHGIMRFRVSKRNFYFEDLAFDGRLDLASELPSKIFPTCMVLIENEDVFRSDLHSHCAAAAATATVATKPQSSSKRRLVFFDRNSRRLTQLQTSVAQPSVAMVTMATHDSILASRLVKCNVNAGHTLSSEITMVKQMISTRDMLICLFDDQSLVNIYNLKTLQLLRTNELSVQRVNADSVHYSLCCVAIDSENNLYSTNGKHIFNYDYDEFKVKGKRIKPVVMGGQDLSQIICLMTILNDGKLALLTDALQDETSQLYILNPVSRRRLNCGSGSEVTAATTT